MLIKISNDTESFQEYCMLEFQGEIIGESLAGSELGTITISKVRVKTTIFKFSMQKEIKFTVF